jgi:hypothetical protein
VLPSGAHTTLADDWKVVNYDERVVTLLHLATGATVPVGDDNFVDYRSDAQRGDQHGSLLLKAQLLVRGLAIEVIPKIHPGEPFSLPPAGLLSEVYLDINLDCHGWKSFFMGIHEEAESDGAPGGDGDVWDLIEKWVHAYTANAFELYKPLFLQGAVIVRNRFDRALQLFGHALPYDFQAQLVRGARQIETEARSYLAIPRIVDLVDGGDGKLSNALFQGRFLGTILVLKSISREADRRRLELLPPA